MKPTYNSINALENLMTIIDKEGKMQVTVKEVLKACQFIEAIYSDAFNDGYLHKDNSIRVPKNNEFDLPKIRKKYKLTQTEFAKKIGVSRSYIAQIEIGNNILTKQSDKKIQDFLNNNPL